jgi:3-mercaptopyruvate sulfurtransferase SseA
MAKIKLFPLLAALLMLVSSCAPATPTAELAPSLAVPVTIEPTATVPSGLPQTDAEVPRVSVEDAAAAIKSGEAVVLDVRSSQAYQASHIPGALSIPLAEIESNPAGLNLDKAKWIITYCT